MRILVLFFLVCSGFAQSFQDPIASSDTVCVRDFPLLRIYKKVVKKDFEVLLEKAGAVRPRALPRFKRLKVSSEKIPFSSKSFGLSPSVTVKSDGSLEFGLAQIEPIQTKCEYEYEIFLTASGSNKDGKRFSVKTTGKKMSFSAPAIYSVK